MKGWRTRIFSLAVALLGLLEYLDPNMIADAFGGQNNRGLVLLGIAATIFVLRQITTTAPGRSD